MECPRCHSNGPDDKSYCGDCGMPLKLAAPPSAEALREQVRAVLGESFKDQKALEIETTQAIVSRVSDWAKLLGFFVAIPLALLAIILAILGVSSYADFSGKVRQVTKEVDGRLAEARDRATVIKKQAEDVTREYEKLQVRLADAQALSKRVEDLSSQVEQIGRKVGIEFKPSSALTPRLRTDLQAFLDSFQGYLEKLGYRPREGKVRLDVRSTLTDNAYYDGTRNELVIGAPLAGDRHVLGREYMHHVLMSVLWSGGARPNMSHTYAAIESGVADYFAASFLGDPRVGQVAAQVLKLDKPFVRNLNNNNRFTGGVVKDFAETYAVGETWGGLFWEMRQRLDQPVADQIIFAAWAGLQRSDLASDQPEGFARRLLDTAQPVGRGKYVDAIRAILASRNLPA